MPTEPIFDWKELSALGTKGEGLEQLALRLAERLSLDPDPSGRGPDHGKDLILTETLSGEVGTIRVRWLVSCKDYATSGKSVPEDDLPAFDNKLPQHRAQGFLLVTTTVESTNAKAVMDANDVNKSGRFHMKVWSHTKLGELLLRSANRDLFRLFLPTSFQRYQAQNAASGLLGQMDGLPDEVRDHLVRTVLPYENVRLLPVQLFPDAPQCSDAAATVIERLVVGQDSETAAEPLAGLSPEGAEQLMKGVANYFPNEAALLAVEAMHQLESDEHRRSAFNVYTELAPGTGEDYLELAGYLPADVIKDVFTNYMIDVIVDLGDSESLVDVDSELLTHGHHYEFYTMVDDPEFEIKKQGEDGEFDNGVTVFVSGSYSFYVTIYLHDEDDQGWSEELRGSYKGRLTPNGFEKDEADVDFSPLQQDSPDEYNDEPDEDAERRLDRLIRVIRANSTSRVTKLEGSKD